MPRPPLISPSPFQALIAFVLMPGVVSYWLPFEIGTRDPYAGAADFVRALLLAPPSLILTWCVVEFWQRGRGTLAPWAPTDTLIVSGPYKLTRNPMYVAVVCNVLAWACVFASPLLGAYGFILACIFHVRVVSGEEPRLARDFPSAWARYRRQTPRWGLRLWAPERA